MVGGIAWAFIIVLGVLGVRWMNDGVYQPIMLFHVPGILLTIITQVQWTAYKKQMEGVDGGSELSLIHI